jgi:hypothetical protein
VEVAPAFQPAGPFFVRLPPALTAPLEGTHETGSCWLKAGVTTPVERSTATARLASGERVADERSAWITTLDGLAWIMRPSDQMTGDAGTAGEVHALGAVPRIRIGSLGGSVRCERDALDGPVACPAGMAQGSIATSPAARSLGGPAPVGSDTLNRISANGRLYSSGSQWIRETMSL